ncbi:pyruvate formate-lyase-activating protein [Lactococcus termiticola]|uniref:Pyruvate formate-lyase-activating enzyme n=1 Tax=Lactococcus termiticola TaxID=2169526 RepID=A0A2R5HJT4_9LACT|nr:pyruvate formate-lyase-activating protein [Lactococcus termiticola]GBG96938.1 pyruvate formate lyase-activating protein [Lactococcus termiticola]
MTKNIDELKQVTGLIHSTESFGTVDGPGVRFVIFVQGCRMRCKYCHNPDTWAMKSDKATTRTVEDVMEEALRFRGFWGDKGGITVSGGEALLQIDFVTALFTYAQSLGIHTTLDTAGQPYLTDPEVTEKIDALLDVTDLVMLDIKEINPERHKALTAQKLDNILKFAEHLSERGNPMWIRHVLVPGESDFDEDLVELGKFVKTLKNVLKFEILPYHTMGEFKWRELGWKYPLEGVKPPTSARVANAKELMDTESYQDYLERIR